MTVKNKITIITPTKNSIYHLPKLAESIRKQTSQCFEWIIIDGGSVDGTKEYCKNNLKNTCTFIESRDSSIYEAINIGLYNSSCEYYLVVGSDDILYENCIEKYSLYAIENYDLIIANVKCSGKILSGYRPYLGWLGHHFVFTSHSVGALIKCSLHKKIGYYDTSFKICADGLIIKQIALNKAYKVYNAKSFVAGEFELGGASNSKVLDALVEGLRVQIRTEENIFIQLIIFILRVMKNSKRIQW